LAKRSKQESVEKAVLLRGSEQTADAPLDSIEKAIADISHEIQQPLATISNYAEACTFQLAKIDHPRAADLLQWLKTIGDEAHRAAGMVRDFQRLINDVPPQRELLSLDSVVGECVRFLSTYLQEVGVTPRVKLEAQRSLVSGDSRELQRVVESLLRHACDSLVEMEPARRRIFITTYLHGDHVHCAVSGSDESDNAEGPLGNFDSLDLESLGVELTACHRAIESHGGQLGTFHIANATSLGFTLPIAEVITG
jgi:signal transduction histidine kinase